MDAVPPLLAQCPDDTPVGVTSKDTARAAFLAEDVLGFPVAVTVRARWCGDHGYDVRVGAAGAHATTTYRLVYALAPNGDPDRLCVTTTSTNGANTGPTVLAPLPIDGFTFYPPAADGLEPGLRGLISSFAALPNHGA